MQKRILILTTGQGGGHRSSSDSIKNALLALEPDLDVNSLDAMEFFPGYRPGGEEGYITFTTRYRLLWKIFFEFTSFFRGISNLVLSRPIYKRFKKLVLDYEPHAILSVHPVFVGSVNICLKKMKSSIPLYTCIIDLVKHSHLWHDKGCQTTYVPTEKMYKLLLAKGFKKENLVHSGFPIGSKFDKEKKSPKTDIGIPEILMVNPSLKRDKVTLNFALVALKYKVNLTIVTGSDQKLRKYLDEHLPRVENLTVLGYIHDMDKRLSRADVLIAKAGPNMILEGVKMCVPVLVSGHIPGQEEKNYQYIVENGYGLRCDTPKRLDEALTRLFANDFELLKEYSLNAQNCKDVYGAEVLAKHLLGQLRLG